MSMPALLTAVRDRIRAALSLERGECDVMPDGQPPPGCGQRYLAVHPGEVRSAADVSLDEYYAVEVTITFRLDYAPTDRRGPQAFLDMSGGLYALADKVKAAVHGNWADVVTPATALIPGAANGFCEALAYKGLSRPRPVGPEWFDAEGDDGGACGIALTVRFADALRMQSIESQT